MNSDFTLTEKKNKEINIKEENRNIIVKSKGYACELSKCSFNILKKAEKIFM